MKFADLTIREPDLTLLRELVLREDGIEAAAYVLCGQSRIESEPWERLTPTSVHRPHRTADSARRRGIGQ